MRYPCSDYEWDERQAEEVEAMQPQRLPCERDEVRSINEPKDSKCKKSRE